ncbi:MAG: hypothetical protein R2910_03995 [Gemmatimonadales bacterium]
MAALALSCLAAPTPIAAQGIGLAQLQGGVAFTNGALENDVLAGGRAALGFRSGHFVFGPEVGYYGLGAETHLTTLGAFVRYGARTSTGWYGIAGLGYQGPGTSGGGESLFGAGVGAGWSGGHAGRSGPSAEARYLFSLQDIGSEMFAGLLLTVGWEFRW